jgi:hypothetical protein
VWTLDEYTDIEQPRTGVFGEDVDLPILRRFLAEVSPMMPADVKVADRRPLITLRPTSCRSRHTSVLSASNSARGTTISDASAVTARSWAPAIYPAVTACPIRVSALMLLRERPHYGRSREVGRDYADCGDDPTGVTQT